MNEFDQQLITAINEIRDLVRLLAEPAIAERDKTLREELKRLVGSSPKKAAAVMIMNGSRNQAMIHQESGIHKGELSTFVKQLHNAGLLINDPKQPTLAISLPENFFDK